MKIIQLITRSDTIGGAQAHVHLLCQQLLREHYRVRVLAGGDGIFHDLLKDEGISCSSINNLKRNFSIISDLKAILEIREVLKKKRPEVLAIHSAKSGLVGRLAALNLGVQIVYTVHGWSHIRNASWFVGFVYSLLDRLLSFCTNEIICVSESDLDFAHNVVKINPKKTNLVYNGCESVAQLDKVRSNLGSDFRFVCVTRFQAPKDNLTLIKALADVNANATEKKAYVDFYGDGEDLGVAKELVRVLGIEKFVTFKGFSNNVKNLYGSYDCLILSSLSEGLPMSIIEAMASKLPVIASDVGGISELVSSYRNGVVFEAKNVPQLSEAICYMMNLSNEDLQIFRQNSLDIYNRKFTALDMYLNTKKVYYKRDKC
ncbi:glycosyltransferase [Vibrio scophthalmi]|uniref:glycosyltransferase n=1 Tax=Vibrio scophthalmi TaxID=45658 RepID=UPI003AAD2EB8